MLLRRFVSACFKYCFCFICFASVLAQNNDDSSNQKQTIKIVNANILSQEMGVCIINSISQPCEIQVLRGNVILNLDQSFIYADSVRINKVEKKFEAFRKIHIVDNKETHVYGNRLIYSSKDRKVWIYEKVKVINKGDTLYTDELLYDKKNGIAQYFKRGEIRSANATITSNEGTYYIKDKKSVLKNKVLIIDTAFVITSDSLEYVNENEKNKTITFISSTQIVLSKGQKIYTKSGFYDILKNDIVLYNYSKIIDSNSLFTANKIHYNTKTKIGYAFKNFMMYDSLNDFTLKADTVYFNNATSYVLATKNCMGKTRSKEGDTIYFSADTVLTQKLPFKLLDSIKKFVPIEQKESFVSMSAQDSSKKQAQLMVPIIKKEKKIVRKLLDTTKTLLNEDSNAIALTKIFKTIKNKDTISNVKESLGNANKDTLGKAKFVKKDFLRKDKKIDSSKKEIFITKDSNALFRFVKAYNHVKIYKDSTQIICDSLWYDDIDSVLKFMQKPIAWINNNMQLFSVSMDAYLKNKSIDSIVANENAVSAEHLKNDFYNQTQADKLIFKIDSNRIKRIDGIGNVVTHHFLESKQKAIIGMNRMTAKNMTIKFFNQKAKQVKYFENVEGKSYPLKKLLRTEAYLERFAWHDTLRPKSKHEFINFKDSIILPTKKDFSIKGSFLFP